MLSELSEEFYCVFRGVVVPRHSIVIQKREPFRAASLDLPQPRIQIVDVASAKIVETIVSPQAILNSLTFSPDGKLLASSGHGEVLLWDFSAPPGQKPLDK